jgi:hypothetical protein
MSDERQMSKYKCFGPVTNGVRKDASELGQWSIHYGVSVVFCSVKNDPLSTNQKDSRLDLLYQNQRLHVPSAHLQLSVFSHIRFLQLTRTTIHKTDPCFQNVKMRRLR